MTENTHPPRDITPNDRTLVTKKKFAVPTGAPAPLPAGKEGRVYIGVFGRRNTGKSTLINLLTGQDTAIVSPVPGTTTDSVSKTVELFGIGAAVLIDTAGIDDTGELGRQRVDRAMQAVRKVDCAVLLVSGNRFDLIEMRLADELKRFGVPFVVVHNKSDEEPLTSASRDNILRETGLGVTDFSAANDDAAILLDELRKIVPANIPGTPSLLGNWVKPLDLVLLITVIDSEAPGGRLILPQNQTIRNALDNECVTVVINATALDHFMTLGLRPALVVTDSQAFGYVAARLPEEIPLTSFSILFARLKGDFEAYLKGTPAISRLKDGHRVLVLESCTHQTGCDDIGRVKIPALLRRFTGKELDFTFVNGLSQITEPMDDFALVVQCGGCMVTRKQLHSRLKPATEQDIPVTNYGMALAYVNGIFERATRIFHNLGPTDLIR